jgi:hypothetical protein
MELSGHKKRPRAVNLRSSSQCIIVLADGSRTLQFRFASSQNGCSATKREASVMERRCYTTRRGSAYEFWPSDSGLSDVTDRSHHWIGAFCRKSFLASNVSGDSRRMPFLGAETALGSVGRRQVAIFPCPWPTVAKRDFWGGDSDILAGFYRPVAGGLRIRASETDSPSHSRGWVFRRNGTEKVRVWYRCSQ